ncbi:MULTISPECIES: iron chaperone [Aurantimicrobium]|uniref:YdhG-like domain-containing protein n=1 Tax=Aurantimicrobium photophilum TaxID=1987356 RepID=A0A2Z3S3S7_9MICO|nr:MULTISPECIES: DUF1801 domain-containing protein [Aurantimicrobium]AWR21823.1 hypothetical protein AURMO_01231 [Aurantimicrobium photophilum]MDH6255781.1 uncharacterized protein YdhG (YjbR/CyaY superfamily) [Aurantimicrobium minutum]
MSTAEIDAYIAAQPEPQRSTLEHLRKQILTVIPEAEQCISYAMPGFRVNGKVVAGFASYKKHIGYYPHSGQVFGVMMDDLAGYVVSEKGGGVQFPIDKAVPDALIEKLIAVRMSQAFPHA